MRIHEILSAYEKLSRPGAVAILNPNNGAVFPPEIPPPSFCWSDTSPNAGAWLISIRFTGAKNGINAVVDQRRWMPSRKQWEIIKKRSRECPAEVAVIGIRWPGEPRYCFRRGNFLFNVKRQRRQSAVLPRSDSPLQRGGQGPLAIRWRFGAIDGDSQPPAVLDNLPVCGNCHSFSANGKTLAMGTSIMQTIKGHMRSPRTERTGWSLATKRHNHLERLSYAIEKTRRSGCCRRSRPTAGL